MPPEPRAQHLRMHLHPVIERRTAFGEMRNVYRQEGVSLATTTDLNGYLIEDKPPSEPISSLPNFGICVGEGNGIFITQRLLERYKHSYEGQRRCVVVDTNDPTWELPAFLEVNYNDRMVVFRIIGGVDIKFLVQIKDEPYGAVFCCYNVWVTSEDLPEDVDMWIGIGVGRWARTASGSAFRVWVDTPGGQRGPEFFEIECLS